MRYAMIYDSNDTPRAARLNAQSAAFFGPSITDLREVITLSVTEREQLLAQHTQPTAPPSSVDQARFAAPLRPHKNIFCVGRNYSAHAAESTRAQGIALEMPDKPTFFTKAPTTIIGPDATMQLPFHISQKFDWEVELAIVIGQRCRDVSEAEAHDVVFGYTIANDVTARDLQKSYGQWFKGKSLDETCPLGPWIVTADEIGDPQNLRLSLSINGVTKQDGNTADMIFPVARIIAELSRGMTLEPGDIIATGTPEGVGFARTPPEFLQSGDIIEATIEKIGTLRTTVG